MLCRNEGPFLAVGAHVKVGAYSKGWFTNLWHACLSHARR